MPGNLPVGVEVSSGCKRSLLLITIIFSYDFALTGSIDIIGKYSNFSRNNLYSVEVFIIFRFLEVFLLTYIAIGNGVLLVTSDLTKQNQAGRRKKMDKSSYTYSDGSKYKGEMKNGKRHGSGILERADGTRYEGEWADGKPNGQGTLTSPDGKQRSGIWENGKLVQESGSTKTQSGAYEDMKRENQQLKQLNHKLSQEISKLKSQQNEESLFLDDDKNSKHAQQEAIHPYIGNASNPQRVSRIVILLAFFRAIILFPQFIVLGFWGFLSMITLFIMWIIAIFTARYPDGMYYFVLGWFQKQIQVVLYESCITHKYPPFRFSGKEFKE